MALDNNRIGYLRQMKRDDLDHVLSWRNHPDVRRYMFTRHVILIEEHLRWFEKAAVDPDRMLMIYEMQCEPLGFVQFSGVADGDDVDWGFYVAPNAQKGTGTGLGIAAMNHAFRVLSKKRVLAQVLAFNEPSVKFHKKLGFVSCENPKNARANGHAAASSDIVFFYLHGSEWSGLAK